MMLAMLSRRETHMSKLALSPQLSLSGCFKQSYWTRTFKRRTTLPFRVSWKDFGHIPLAVTQAAALIKRNRWPIETYAQAIAGDDQKMSEYLSQELQDPRRPRGFPNSIFQTWKISLKQIDKQEPVTAEILSLLSILACERISLRQFLKS